MSTSPSSSKRMLCQKELGPFFSRERVLLNTQLLSLARNWCPRKELFY